MKLAIVGAGAATVALLDRLSRGPDPVPGRITVFDPAPQLWRGRPYQHDLDSVRVNILPEHMSVRAGEPRDFSTWLAGRGFDHDGRDFTDVDRFPPRHVYGQYLCDRAEGAVARLRERGCRVEIVPRRVVSALPCGGGIRLSTVSGSRYRTDRLVLGVGAATPDDHFGLTGHPGFHADPYPLRETVAGLDPDAGVAVLGTGLAAVDVAVTLLGGGHRGPIVLASRSGSLPMVRQRPADLALSACTPHTLAAITAGGRRLGLDDVAYLLADDIVAAGGDPSAVLTELVAVECEDPTARLRRHLAMIDDPDPAIRLAQKAVPLSGPDLWVRLQPRAQALVRSRYYRAVQSLCCPMPPGNARVIAAGIEQNRLAVQRGLWNVEPVAGGGFDIFTTDGVFRADTVLNATGAAAHRQPPAARDLLVSLVAAGLASHHPDGGLWVDPATSRTVVDGRPIPSVYAMGDIESGTLFFTSGMPSVVDRAADVAHSLATAAVTDSPDGRSSDLCTAQRPTS
ncbi:FAD/NAD(P)-binding protein [Nocardia sp. CDC159]|uniref:FAD/NAD(P)-binding protein n=1 Tax=Nocardia pulmonis TaxID=2951408 RepID=A0A9X2E4C0_9NOCA|nr:MULTISPECIES: FAD/NAD(P)-binding protein [Nocardia]MCM6773897.1 FAD/NAD(P)-binding protein [Nocardia pulmonis]MCM6786784.1 FAD/NAD(P)-binding protein [Nocardia sp. CDC159]